jgi:hypothetical protein
MALANYCSTLLDRAELRVQQVGQLPPDELAALLDAPVEPGQARPTPPGEGSRRAEPPAPVRAANTPLGGPYRRPGAATPERPGPRDRRNPDYDPLFDEEL